MFNQPSDQQSNQTAPENINNKNPNCIFLIGPMGSGKSTIGAKLAAKLKCIFIDQDRFIEEQYQTTISEIFATQGEATFRNLETLFLEGLKEKLSNNNKLVIACGGGVVINPVNVALMKQLGTIIYLEMSFLIQYERLIYCNKRPLAQDKENLLRNLAEMAKKRNPLYQEASDITISINKPLGKSFSNKNILIKILRSIKDYYQANLNKNLN